MKRVKETKRSFGDASSNIHFRDLRTRGIIKRLSIKRARGEVEMMEEKIQGLK